MVCDMDGFKQVNDRFGHLEGNRVLRLFAHAVKRTCREYDYVARMGGDEFVMVISGLTADTAKKRAQQLKELARQAGHDVCGEDILSLSTGHAIHPKDGEDAETLLAEADRRMYQEKEKQPFRKNRRLYPRVNGRITIEIRQKGDERMFLGNLTNISLGGCYVETGAILPAGSQLSLTFSIEEGKVEAGGTVIRLDPGSGVALQFNDTGRDDRGKIRRVLESVQKASNTYDRKYFEKMLKR